MIYGQSCDDPVLVGASIQPLYFAFADLDLFHCIFPPAAVSILVGAMASIAATVMVYIQGDGRRHAIGVPTTPLTPTFLRNGGTPQRCVLARHLTSVSDVRCLGVI